MYCQIFNIIPKSSIFVYVTNSSQLKWSSDQLRDQFDSTRLRIQNVKRWSIKQRFNKIHWSQSQRAHASRLLRWDKKKMIGGHYVSAVGYLIADLCVTDKDETKTDGLVAYHIEGSLLLMNRSTRQHTHSLAFRDHIRSP